MSKGRFHISEVGLPFCCTALLTHVPMSYLHLSYRLIKGNEIEWDL